MPSLRKLFRIAQAGLFGQSVDDGANLGEMDRRGAAYGALDIRFNEHVDEGAALKCSLAKPAVEHIEDRQQSSVRRRGAPPDLGLKPTAGPHRFAPVQEGNRQIGLGTEIAVKAGLCAT